MTAAPVLRTALAITIGAWLASADAARAEPEEPLSEPETTAAAPDNKPAADKSDADSPAADAAASKPPEAIAEKKPDSLTVASWGGAYSESQKRAYFTPFENETGIAIDVVSHNGKFDVLSGDAGADKPGWDLVDLDPAALERACRDGLLEKVDAAALADGNDGAPARDDFFAGTLHECGVPSVAWSSAIVFDRRAFEKTPPKAAKDFFDVKNFPGMRALPRGPKYTLELALMADGVAPDDVYATLATETGVARALKRLDAIRDHVVWWKRAHQPLRLLARQEAAMAIAFNGRIFSAIVAETKPFGIIWDGQVFDLDLWAIPKGTPHAKSAMDFITFATKPDRLAHQARWFPYGPLRKSALELVGKHPEVDVDMTAYIPTSRRNFKRALRLNTHWWQIHEARLNERFRIWMVGDAGSAKTGLDAETENAAATPQ